jgi:hypothetical protein
MKPYKKIRDFTPQEIQEELGEYFENDYTRSKFPKLAKDENELRGMIKTAKLINLTQEEMMRLDNSDVGDILSSDNPFQAAFNMAKQNERNIDKIYNGIKSNTAFPAPIIIKKNGQLYLMGGNTRICAFAAINLSISVKMIQHK